MKELLEANGWVHKSELGKPEPWVHNGAFDARMKISVAELKPGIWSVLEYDPYSAITDNRVVQFMTDSMLEDFIKTLGK